MSDEDGENFLNNIKVSPLKVQSRLGYKSTPIANNHSREITRHKRKRRSSRSESPRKSARSPYKSTDKSFEGNASNNSAHESSFSDLLSLSDYNNSPATTPSGRDNKAGWYNIHDKHTSLSSTSKTQIILIGDSIIAGLSRYPRIWQAYFKPHRALNFGIGGDRTQHVLWRAENIDLPQTTKYLVIHCGTNNIDRDSPRDIANGIISIGLTLQEKNPGLKVVVTGILPRDLDWSHRRDKIKQTNNYLKTQCSKKLIDFYFMKEDSDWTFADGRLNTEFYYTDHLHLVETGNEKFAKSIAKLLGKLINHENVEYSSGDDVNDSSFVMERKRSHKRQRSVSPHKSYGDSYSTERKRKRHSDDHHLDNTKDRKHKRHSNEDTETTERSKRRYGDDAGVDSKHNSKHSNKFKWSKFDDNVEDTPNKWSTARKWSKIIKEEHHDHFKKLDQPNEATGDDQSETSKEEITSIDISLGDRERKAARLAKFSNLMKQKDLNQISALTKSQILNKEQAPSKLVMKIRQSQEEQRKKLENQRRLSSSLVNYSSPTSSSQDDTMTSSQNESIEEGPDEKEHIDKVQNTKKFFSDYTAGSDSE